MASLDIVTSDLDLASDFSGRVAESAAADCQPSMTININNKIKCKATSQAEKCVNAGNWLILDGSASKTLKFEFR